MYEYKQDYIYVLTGKDGTFTFTGIYTGTYGIDNKSPEFTLISYNNYPSDWDMDYFRWNTNPKKEHVKEIGHRNNYPEYQI